MSATAWTRRTCAEMAVSGAVGLVASFVLSIEAWQLAMDSTTRFGCDVSSALVRTRCAPLSTSTTEMPAELV